MNKTEDSIFGPRRLLIERRKRAQAENLVRRDPAKYKKLAPNYARRLKKGA